MSLRAVRIGVLLFFLAYLGAVTWPGALFFRAAEPFILGIPSSFFWPALWIALGGVALAVLDHTEERDQAPTLDVAMEPTPEPVSDGPVDDRPEAPR